MVRWIIPWKLQKADGPIPFTHIDSFLLVIDLIGWGTHKTGFHVHRRVDTYRLPSVSRIRLEKLTLLKGISRGFLFVLFSKSLEPSPTTSPNVASSKESSVYLQNVVSQWSSEHGTNSSFQLVFLLRIYTNAFSTGEAILMDIQAIDPHIWSNGQSRLQRVDPRFHLIFVQLNFIPCLSNAMRIVRPMAI